MDLTRKQVIEELQKMLDYCSIRQDSTPERKQALVYAISSLKADEAYNLMYEGVEVYTKEEVISMLEELHEKMREKHEEYFAREEFDEAYGIDDAMDDVKAKIKELRGKTDETK